MELQHNEEKALLEKENKLIKMYEKQVEHDIPIDIEKLNSELSCMEIEENEIKYEISKIQKELEIQSLDIDNRKRTLNSFHKSVGQITNNPSLSKTNKSYEIGRMPPMQYEEKEREYQHREVILEVHGQDEASFEPKFSHDRLQHTH